MHKLDAKMAAPHSPREALAALEAAIYSRSADASGPDPIPTEVVRLLLAGGPCDMGMLTSALAISEQPQWLTSRIAMALLRRVLPEVMFSAQELAIETIRQAGHRTPSQAEQRLEYLEELARRVVDDYLKMETPSEALKQKLQEIQREINSLRDQVADEDEDRVADEQLAAGLGSLLGEPLKLFDALPRGQAGADLSDPLPRGPNRLPGPRHGPTMATRRIRANVRRPASHRDRLRGGSSAKSGRDPLWKTCCRRARIRRITG